MATLRLEGVISRLEGGGFSLGGVAGYGDLEAPISVTEVHRPPHVLLNQLSGGMYTSIRGFHWGVECILAVVGTGGP
eukprot:1363003-Pyramimonas_sp.AAC.1